VPQDFGCRQNCVCTFNSHSKYVIHGLHSTPCVRYTKSNKAVCAKPSYLLTHSSKPFRKCSSGTNQTHVGYWERRCDVPRLGSKFTARTVHVSSSAAPPSPQDSHSLPTVVQQADSTRLLQSSKFLLQCALHSDTFIPAACLYCKASENITCWHLRVSLSFTPPKHTSSIPRKSCLVVRKIC
jgi:hypothetical protein